MRVVDAHDADGLLKRLHQSRQRQRRVRRLGIRPLHCGDVLGEVESVVDGGGDDDGWLRQQLNHLLLQDQLQELRCGDVPLEDWDNHLIEKLALTCIDDTMLV